jgi:Carbohydrate family 9 binding domain-like
MIARVALVALTSFALHAADESLLSVRASKDVALDTNSDSEFWREARPLEMDRENNGKRLATDAVVVRSRWTTGNLYFLFRCPYDELYLKPNPATATETNELWNWDVAEIFIGSDFQNIRRYKEFEVSPQGEWVDLDIDLAKPHPEGGWTWNSGFLAAARIDAHSKVWYAALRIPISAVDSRPHPPAKETEFRINLYVSEGPPSNHKSIAWRPTMKPNFHVPERFGILRLAGPPN